MGEDRGFSKTGPWALFWFGKRNHVFQKWGVLVGLYLLASQQVSIYGAEAC